MKLTPKNWKSFQHYNKRTPPWIKLHRTLLDDFEYQRLPVASKALAPMLWLLASEHEGGAFDASTDFLAFRLRWNAEDVEEGLKPLIERGFFVDASTMLANCSQHATPETETETETERERFKPPSLEEVKDYCKSRRNSVDPEAFINFYASKGWMLGKNKMKDWKRAVITWELREKKTQPLADPADRWLT